MHVNEIKLIGEDDFAVKFNRCSDLFALAFDETLPEEERAEYFDRYMNEKIALEMGY